MRTSRLFARSSALLALPLFACATLFAACGGDDSSGATTDAGGTTDSSQGDTGTADTGPGIDAAHDSATADSAADASHDSSTTDAPANDGNVEASGDDGGDGAVALLPCANNVVPDVAVTVGAGGNLSFSPPTVTIQAGQTVQWNWAAGGHTVTSMTAGTCTPDNAYCSPSDTSCSTGTTSASGASYCHTFPTAGTFDYACVPHCDLGMKGTVVVQ